LATTAPNATNTTPTETYPDVASLVGRQTLLPFLDKESLATVISTQGNQVFVRTDPPAASDTSTIHPAALCIASAAQLAAIGLLVYRRTTNERDPYGVLSYLYSPRHSPDSLAYLVRPIFSHGPPFSLQAASLTSSTSPYHIGLTRISPTTAYWHSENHLLPYPSWLARRGLQPHTSRTLLPSPQPVLTSESRPTPSPPPSWQSLAERDRLFFRSYEPHTRREWNFRHVRYLPRCVIPDIVTLFDVHLYHWHASADPPDPWKLRDFLESLILPITQQTGAKRLVCSLQKRIQLLKAGRFTDCFLHLLLHGRKHNRRTAPQSQHHHIKRAIHAAGSTGCRKALQYLRNDQKAPANSGDLSHLFPHTPTISYAKARSSTAFWRAKLCGFLSTEHAPSPERALLRIMRDRPRNEADITSLRAFNGSCSLVLQELLEILTGHVVEASLPWVRRSDLIALKKPNGKIRPIGIGNVARRLAGRLALVLLRPSTSAWLEPAGQLGSGTIAGCETIVHGTRLSLELEHLDAAREGRAPNIACVKADIKNAFNSIPRHRIREALSRHLPDLLPIFDVLYGGPAPMIIEHTGEVLYSTTGVTQGCSLGPLLCSAFMAEITSPLRQSKPLDATLACYMDDLTLIGPTSWTTQAVSQYISAIESSSPHLKVTKVYGLAPPGARITSLPPLPAEGRWLTPAEDFTLLSIPLTEAASHHLKDTLRLSAESKRLLFKIGSSHDPGALYRILTLSVSQKSVYWSRCMPPSWSLQIAQKSDNTLWEGLLKLLLVPRTSASPSEWQRAKEIAKLPARRFGGLGLTSLEAHRGANFATCLHKIESSLTCTFPLVAARLYPALAKARSITHNPDLAELDAPPSQPLADLPIVTVQAYGNEIAFLAWASAKTIRNAHETAVRDFQVLKSLHDRHSHRPTSAPIPQPQEIPPLPIYLAQHRPILGGALTGHTAGRIRHAYDHSLLTEKLLQQHRGQAIRLLEQSSPLASGFLLNNNSRTKIRGAAFRILILDRLLLDSSLPGRPDPSQRCNLCRRPENGFVVHSDHCTPLLYTRHNGLRDGLALSLRTAGMRVVTETDSARSLTHVGPDTASSHRVDLAILSNHASNPDHFVDVSVTNPLAPSYINRYPDASPKLALELHLRHQSQAKRNIYEALVASRGGIFSPFVVSLRGAFGPRARTFWEQLASNIQTRAALDDHHPWGPRLAQDLINRCLSTHFAAARAKALLSGRQMIPEWCSQGLQ